MSRGGESNHEKQTNQNVPTETRGCRSIPKVRLGIREPVANPVHPTHC
jgi:hypothetical protein